MKIENEITVLVESNYNTLKTALEMHEFKVRDEYELKDDYMIEQDINLLELSNLEILQKCILVRNVINRDKMLLYKYKKYASNGDIICQSNVNCPIVDINSAIKFMKAINYRKLFSIYDKCILYANEETELLVQLVNDKYIFLEIDANCKHINKQYKSIEEIKNDLNRYKLPIDNSNYFVKKAELVLDEQLKTNSI